MHCRGDVGIVGYRSCEIGISLHFMRISHEMRFSAASSCLMTLKKHRILHTLWPAVHDYSVQLAYLG